RCPRARHGRGAGDPTGTRAGDVRGGGRGRGAHHARLDLAPGRLAGDRGGPVIVGRTGDGDVLRLEGFLARNGHPRQRLDPETDAEARALIERFHVEPGQLPIVLCPNGQLLRNPGETELARCIGMVGPIDPDRVYDVAIVGAGPAGLATAVYAASEGLS